MVLYSNNYANDGNNHIGFRHFPYGQKRDCFYQSTAYCKGIALI